MHSGIGHDYYRYQQIIFITPQQLVKIFPILHKIKQQCHTDNCYLQSFKQSPPSPQQKTNK